MSDKIWYFARGDSEHGPVTAKQIRTLATTGKLRGDDLVWREGMPDWALAGEVQELFGDETDVASEPEIDRLPGDRADTDEDERPPLGATPTRPPFVLAVREMGYYGIFAGMLIAVVAKGCDMTHERYAASVTASVAHAQSSFEAEWNDKKTQLQQRQQQLTEGAETNPVKRQQLQQVEEDLANWDANRAAEQHELDTTTWSRLRQKSADANQSQQAWRYYRSLAFLMGSLILVCGLIMIGGKGIGPERWICLGIVAIIVYSLFVGGDAWSLLNSGE